MAASLLVKIEELKSYSTELSTGKTTLQEYMDLAKNQMSEISSNWDDDSGSLIQEKFDSFIKSAKTLCDEMGALSSYAKQEADEYERILSTHAAQME